MNLQLEGKTALVTGSTAGIGLAIAAASAKEGAAVIVNGRTQERVDKSSAYQRRPSRNLGGTGTEPGTRCHAHFRAVESL